MLLQFASQDRATATSPSCTFSTSQSRIGQLSNTATEQRADHLRVHRLSAQRSQHSSSNARFRQLSRSFSTSSPTIQSSSSETRKVQSLPVDTTHDHGTIMQGFRHISERNSEHIAATNEKSGPAICNSSRFIVFFCVDEHCLLQCFRHLPCKLCKDHQSNSVFFYGVTTP